jgi:hypothetical protein
MTLADLPRNKHGIPVMPVPDERDRRRRAEAERARWDDPAVRYNCAQRRKFNRADAEDRADTGPAARRVNRRPVEAWHCPTCHHWHVSGRAGDLPPLARLR